MNKPRRSPFAFTPSQTHPPTRPSDISAQNSTPPRCNSPELTCVWSTNWCRRKSLNLYEIRRSEFSDRDRYGAFAHRKAADLSKVRNRQRRLFRLIPAFLMVPFAVTFSYYRFDSRLNHSRTVEAQAT